MLLSAVGLSALIAASPLAYDLVRWGGAAWLAVLGIRILRAPSLLPGDAGESATGGSLAVAARRGFATNALNPKALLFASILLPQFVSPDAGGVALQFAGLGVILVAMGIAADLGAGFAGQAFGRFLRGHRLVERVQRWVFGAILIGFGLRLAANA